MSVLEAGSAHVEVFAKSWRYSSYVDITPITSITSTSIYKYSRFGDGLPEDFLLLEYADGRCHLTTAKTSLKTADRYVQLR